MADMYIETFSDVMQWKIDEWIGRCYAQSVGELYPIPDTSLHYKENGYYYKYAEQKRDMPGGVLTVDDTIIGFSDRIQQLSDMSYFCPDVTTNIRTYDQLSDDGKAIIPGPPGTTEEEAAPAEASSTPEVSTPDAAPPAVPSQPEVEAPEPAQPEVEQPAEPAQPATPEAPAAPEQQPSDPTLEQWEDL